MTRRLARRRAAALAGLMAVAGAAPLRAQAPVFDADAPLALTLRADFSALLRRHEDTTTWWPARLAWSDGAGAHEAPAELRQRGHFRRIRCGDMTPLRLRFEGDSVRGTPWAGARRPRLVTHCRDSDEYEQYVLSEYALYRLWGLLTPASLRVRLLRITWENPDGRVRARRYALLVEDPARLAERLGGSVLDIRTVTMGNLRRSDMAQLGTFQYLVGNADWSVGGLHNIVLVRTPDTVLAVPFDFDWTGAVDARYAYGDERLGVRTVRERVYRGLCQDSAALEPALARVEALRDSIAALYGGLPGMRRGTVERTLRYFDEFYREIADRRRFVREVVQRRCLRS